MKFKVILKNSEFHFISADNYKEAQKLARKKFGEWQSIKTLFFQKERKSEVLNKREWVKESNKKYNRLKEKREFKRKLNYEEY